MVPEAIARAARFWDGAGPPCIAGIDRACRCYRNDGPPGSINGGSVHEHRDKPEQVSAAGAQHSADHSRLAFPQLRPAKMVRIPGGKPELCEYPPVLDV